VGNVTILSIYFSPLVDGYEVKTEYSIHSLDDEIANSNHLQDNVDLKTWNERLTLSRMYGAFDVQNKYTNLEVNHTLFAAPYCSSSIVDTLPDGKVPNSDWKKRHNSAKDNTQLDQDIELQPAEFSLARIEEMLYSSTNPMIRKFASKLELVLKSSSKADMVRQIIKHLRKKAGVTEPIFDKFFPTFLRTTGGIMAGTCQHGIVYYAKPIIGGESVADACDAMITVGSKVFVYDAIGTAVRSMNARIPDFFGKNLGFPCIVSNDLIKVVQDQTHNWTPKIATKSDLRKTSSWSEILELDHHVGLCDPLHLPNSKNIADRTLRDIKLIDGLNPHLNSMPHEQLWARTKGLSASINKMNYGDHIARFVRNCLIFNRNKNRQMLQHMQ
jgi:hypothetical protein